MSFVQGPRGFSGTDGRRLVAVDGFLFPGPASSPEKELTALLESWCRDPEDLKARAGGSFAACIYDSGKGTVHLLRDRFGVRPLWYMQSDRRIVVASECRILQSFAEETGVHDGALQESIVFRRVSGPNHIVSPLRQVLPGTEVILSPGAPVLESRYWSMDFEQKDVGGIDATKVDEADEAIRKSYYNLGVSGQPVAVLLSGGVDSSVLAATAREECSDVLCVVGRDPDNPECESGRAIFVAEALGLESLVVDIDPSTFADDWREMTIRIGEPSRNQNNLVLQQLFRAIPDGIPSVLIGDGAENVFGMGVVDWIQKFERKKRWIDGLLPTFATRPLANLLRRMDGVRAWQLARLLDMDKAAFAAVLSAIEYGPGVMKALWPWIRDGAASVFPPEERKATGWAFSDHFLVSSAYTYLQSSIIRQERLAAPENLFPLYPFFAPSVVDFGLALGPSHRYVGPSKPMVRAVCDRYLPSEVSRWPKMGFPVPWREWMGGPLKTVRGLLGPEAKVRDHVPPQLLRAVEETDDLEGIWTLASLEVVLQDLL
jgi:asparagine synthase (glutamine-hydrolysing)